MENVRRIIPDEDDKKIDFYAYWKIFWRKKFYLIVPMALSLIIAVVGVRQLTPIYESSTLVSAEDQNILASTMRRYVTPNENRSSDQSRRFQGMIETRIMSREFLELVITDLGLQRSFQMRVAPSGREGLEGLSEDDLTMRHLVEILRNKISVTTTINGFYNISVMDTDPVTAYVLATKISEKYIDVTQQAKLQGLRQAGAFSDEQLAIYKEMIEESEHELDRVRRELAATDVERNPINAANVRVAEARVNSLSARVNRNEMDLKRVRDRLMSVFGMVPSTDKISSDETLNNIERQLIAYEEERILQELAGNDDAVADGESSDALWQELRARTAEIVRVEYRDYSDDHKPLITEYFYQRKQTSFFSSMERRLNGYIDQYRHNISRRPQLEREENKLVHEVETNQAIYDAFLESKTSAQINEAIQSTNLGVRINIVENAQRPISPVKPDKLKIIIMALMFGVMCGLGSILATEYMDDSFKRVEEVQKLLKLPVLGTIPKTISYFDWEKKKRGKMMIIWLAGIIIFTAVVSGAMFVYAKALQGSGIGVELSEDQLGR